MIIITLQNQPSHQELTQRENIFQKRCKVLENACSLIGDSGSCCNCCSTRLVENLALLILPHLKPYKLQWINNDKGMVFNQQVEVKFSTRNFEDSVLYDIVLMEACHILLGRPWLFERETIHHGHTNEITFTLQERKIVLHPLTPSQVEEDQVQMRIKREKEREDTCAHKSDINCSKCQSSTHKSKDCPNKRVLMLRAKRLCEDSKEVFFPPSFSRIERQDQIRPFGGKESHSKNTWIPHKAHKSLKRKAPQLQSLDHSFDQRCIIFGSYMLWKIITLTLSLIFCRRIFDPSEKKVKHLQEKEG